MYKKSRIIRCTFQHFIIVYVTVEILCQEANMPSSILFSTGIGVADVLHMPYMPQNHGLEDVEAPRPFPIDVWHMFLQ